MTLEDKAQRILNILGFPTKNHFDFWFPLIKTELQTNTHIFDMCVVQSKIYISPSNRFLLLGLS